MPGDASPDEGALLYLAANELDARLDTIAGKTYRQRERQWYEQRTGRARTSGIRLRHARALLLLDQADAAADSLRAIRAEGDSSVSAIGLSAVTAARVGRFPDSDGFLAQLHRIDSRRTTAQRALAEGDVAYWVAATAAQRRNHAMAVSTLRDAFSAGRPKDPGAASDPLFAPIRSNPEYGALLRYDG